MQLCGILIVSGIVSLSDNDESSDEKWSFWLEMTEKIDVEDPKLPKIQKISQKCVKVLYHMLLPAALTHYKEIKMYFFFPKQCDCNYIIEFEKDDCDQKD